MLTVPTAGHGEQMLNSRVHARSLPHLVRAKNALRAEDVQWLLGFV